MNRIRTPRQHEIPNPRRPLEEGELGEPIETSPGKKSGLRTWHKVAAAGAAGLALAGAGVFAGTKLAGGSDRAPEKPPAAGAPETPGKGASGQGQEAAPKPENKNWGNWNETNIPLAADLNNDGKMEQYVGIKQLEKAAEVKVKDNPTEEAALETIVNKRVNAYVNWGSDPTQRVYKGYKSSDGQSTDTEGVSGDFVTPAFTNALTAEEQNSTLVLPEATTTWMSTLRYMQLDASLKNDFLTESTDSQVPYKLTFDVDRQEWPEPVVADDVSKGSATVGWKDNAIQTRLLQHAEKMGMSGMFEPKTGSDQWNVNIQKQPNEDGEEVWKVVGIDIHNTDSY